MTQLFSFLNFKEKQIRLYKLAKSLQILNHVKVIDQLSKNNDYIESNCDHPKKKKMFSSNLTTRR